MDIAMDLPTDILGRLRALAERHGRSIAEELTALVEEQVASDEVHQEWARHAATLSHLTLEEKAARTLRIEQMLFEKTERRARAGGR